MASVRMDVTLSLENTENGASVGKYHLRHCKDLQKTKMGIFIYTTPSTRHACKKGKFLNKAKCPAETSRVCKKGVQKMFVASHIV